MDLKISEIKWRYVDSEYNLWKSFKKEDPKPNSIKIDKINYTIPSEIGEVFHVAAFLGDQLVGMCALDFKIFEHIKIGCIGSMAVDPHFRGNGIAREILLYMKNIMEKKDCDISVLWASVLKVYESVGYKAYFGNMMCLPVKSEIKLEMLLNLYVMPDKIGYW